MMAIASAYEMQPPGQKDFAKAIGHAASSMPPCKAYIKSIGDFVGRFAGGESFKLLKYLDFIGFLAAICRISFQVSRLYCQNHAGSFQEEYTPQLAQADANPCRLISGRFHSSAIVQAHASHCRLFAMTDSHTHFSLATVYVIVLGGRSTMLFGTKLKRLRSTYGLSILVDKPPIYDSKQEPE